MAMKTWSFNLKYADVVRKIRITAGEDKVSTLRHKLSQAIEITAYRTELRGFTDEPGELQSGWMTILGRAEYDEPTDPEGYKIAIAALMARIPDTETVPLKGKLIDELIAEAKRIFSAHLPVRDVRVDRVEKAAKDAESQKMTEAYEARRAAERAAFVADWCRDDKPITVPEGMEAITLSLCYDASDMMSDYYQPHASLGPVDMLLQYTSKGRQTEEKARGALSHYPELAKLDWEWHTEKWSMGHGNYLKSKRIGTFTQGAGDYEKQVAGFFEVEFQSGRHSTILPYGGYKG